MNSGSSPSNEFWGFPAGARKGRWSAFIGPMFSRAVRLYLLQRSHNSEGNAFIEKSTDGTQTIIPIKEYAVSFQMTSVEEGDLPKDATLTSSERDALDFLQAIVDCAWQMGIVPTEYVDRQREIETLRNHLEDMRALNGLRTKEVGALPPSPSRRFWTRSKDPS